MMNKAYIRFIVFSMTYIAFWFVSTYLYFHLIHDVGATYWSLGINGYPVVALLFITVDFFLNKYEWVKRNRGKYMTISCISGVLLYYPALTVVMAIFYFQDVGNGA